LFECIDEKTRIVKRLLVLEEEQMLCGMEMRKSQKLMQADSAKEMEIRKRLMEQQGEQAKEMEIRNRLMELQGQCRHANETDIRKRLMELQGEQAKSEHDSDDRDLSKV
jgi:hypothetical protein